jgi:N-dimethylarginine dimethylaminohydrolase
MSTFVANEWTTLREVVLGSAHPMYWYSPGDILKVETSASWLALMAERVGGRLLAGRRMPEWLRRQFEREIEAIGRILAQRGITVHRPAAIRPAPGEAPGLSQVFARDPIIAIGDTLVVGLQRVKALRKEIRGLQHVLQHATARGMRIIRLPRDQEEMFLEGGDVLVDLPYVFVGVGSLASSLKGAQWLQQQLGPAVQVVPVAITQPGIFHLDTCLTLIGPRLGIIHREALQTPLPQPLREYQFIEVDSRTRREIGINVFSLDPATLIMQRRHRRLQSELEAKGYRVIPVPFHFHALSGGGLRCVTHPLSRA